MIYVLDKLQTSCIPETNSGGSCNYFITCLLFSSKISSLMFLLPFMEVPKGKYHTLIGLIILVQILKSMSFYAYIFIQGFVYIHLKST